MSGAWWSYTLTLVGVAGFVLAGRKVWWAWYVNIANQALWLAYSLVTQQWGFLLGVVVYTVVFTRNAALWTREHRSSPDVCAVSGLDPCPWHPDGGNHPEATR